MSINKSPFGEKKTCLSLLKLKKKKKNDEQEENCGIGSGPCDLFGRAMSSSDHRDQRAPWEIEMLS